MALVNKRIIDLPERAELNSDDYTVVDGSNGGTAKYKLSKMQEDITTVDQDVEQLSGTVTQHGQQLTTINQTVTQNTSDITDLKADLTDMSTDGIVPTARQLLSDKYAVDEEPYKFRASFAGDRMDDEIVGGTVVWNQFANLNSRTMFGITVSRVNESTIRVTGTISSVDFGYVNSTSSAMAFQTTHVYIVWVNGPSSASSYLKFHQGSKATPDILNSPSIFKYAGGTSGNCIETTATGDVDYTFHWNKIDLTKMFGAEVADYIYNLEQANAGAGVAYFRKLFPNGYYEYDAGTLKHVEGLSAHVMRDADNNVVGNYPLDSTLTLRGVPKLGDNGLYFDGDHYKADGTVERKYGIVDLGTLNWAYYSDTAHFYVTFSASKTTGNNFMCSKYLYGGVASQNDMANKETGLYRYGNIFRIKDTAYTDAASFKAAMSGVYLVYELATPTTETAQPYQNPQIVDDRGTEEYVTTSIVPVGHYTKYYDDLRKKLDGLPWNLGMIAPIETGTTASQAYAVGKYFLLNYQLCKAKTAIASGATFTLNTNYEVTTVADELYTALNS